jgi:phosphatidylserine/phosphatidylglycerophosphate/cardiolipin synthase-like enzyme
VTVWQRIAVVLLVIALVIAAVWGLAQFGRSLIEDSDERPTPTALPDRDPGDPQPTRATGDPRFDPGPGVAGLFVEPDDGRAPILDELGAAERSIDLTVYLLTDPEIIEALEAAVDRGVRVRVILEQHPFGGSGDNPDVFDRLARAGAEVRWSSPAFRFSHVKTFVIDDQVAIVMNLNLTRSAFDRNREFGVVTTRAAEVAQAAAIFEADWKQTSEPPDGPLVVSPTTSRRDLLRLIGGAQRSLDLYAEVVRDREMIDALIAAERRGVAVRLVMTGSTGDDNADERRELAAAGVEIRLARGLYIHAKLFLADGMRLFIGSENLTATALDLNRELGLFLDDPAAIERVEGVFADDFARGETEVVLPV